MNLCLIQRDDYIRQYSQNKNPRNPHLFPSDFMPNLNLGFYGDAVARTACGPAQMPNIIMELDGTTIKNRYVCNIGINWTAVLPNMKVGGFWACVTFDSISSNKELINCKLTSFKCISNTHYINNGCASCPSHTSAIQYNPDTLTSVSDIAHTISTCNYCMSNYYKSGDGCVACPESGKTAGDGHLGIDRCYIPSPDDGRDTTGTYVYTSDKCYYN